MSKGFPIISVIIPVYNDEKYICECIDSVLGQSFQDFEIICVNDGSTDNTGVLLENYRNDERVKIFRQVNSGRSSARNRALDLATGEYFFFLDADDYLPDSNVFEDLVDVTRREKVKLCRGINLICQKGTNVPQRFSNLVDDTIYFKEGWHSTSEPLSVFGWTAYLYSANLINENHIRFREQEYFEDPLFLTEVLSHTDCFFHINRNVYCIRGGTHAKPNDLHSCYILVDTILKMVQTALFHKKTTLAESAVRALLYNKPIFYQLCKIYMFQPEIVRTEINQINKMLNEVDTGLGLRIGIEELTEIVQNAAGYEEKLVSYMNEKKELLIYGAGIYGKQVFHILKKMRRKVSGFAVSKQGDNPTTVLGIKCQEIAQWAKEKSATNYNIIVSVAARNEADVNAVLREYGVENAFFFNMDLWNICHEIEDSIYPDKA